MDSIKISQLKAYFDSQAQEHAAKQASRTLPRNSLSKPLPVPVPPCSTVRVKPHNNTVSGKLFSFGFSKKKDTEKEKERDDCGRERDKEKESEREEKDKEREREREKKKERSRSKKKADATVIGAPCNVIHKTHVDQNWSWSGEDPYEIFAFHERLGQGAYATVYRATHHESGHTFAIKIILDTTREAQREITKEVDLMKRIHHTNTVAYLGTISSLKNLWILMEFVGLGSFRDFIENSNRPFTDPEVTCVLPDILCGLGYLHDRGIVHRDVKAANLLLNEKGDVKIADFGVSEQLGMGGGRATRTHQMLEETMGTPLWMAPEVILAKKYDFKADIWSLGITIIELLDGFPPLADINPLRAMRMIPKNESPTAACASSLSADLNHFISQCLKKSADERPLSPVLSVHPITKKVQPDIRKHLLKEFARWRPPPPEKQLTVADIENPEPACTASPSALCAKLSTIKGDGSAPHDFSTSVVHDLGDDVDNVDAFSTMLCDGRPQSPASNKADQPDFLAYIKAHESDGEAAHTVVATSAGADETPKPPPNEQPAFMACFSQPSAEGPSLQPPQPASRASTPLRSKPLPIPPDDKGRSNSPFFRQSSKDLPASPQDKGSPYNPLSKHAGTPASRSRAGSITDSPLSRRHGSRSAHPPQAVPVQHLVRLVAEQLERHLTTTHGSNLKLDPAGIDLLVAQMAAAAATQMPK